MTEECFRLKGPLEPVESISCAGIRAQEVSSLRPSHRRQVAPNHKRIYKEKLFICGSFLASWVISPCCQQLPPSKPPHPQAPGHKWRLQSRRKYSLCARHGRALVLALFNPHRPMRAKKQSWHRPSRKLLTTEVSQELQELCLLCQLFTCSPTSQPSCKYWQRLQDGHRLLDAGSSKQNKLTRYIMEALASPELILVSFQIRSPPNP